MDALDTDQRHALQMASVIGPVLRDDAPAALDEHGNDALRALQRKAGCTPTASFSRWATW